MSIGNLKFQKVTFHISLPLLTIQWTSEMESLKSCLLFIVEKLFGGQLKFIEMFPN
jgi:hypothetical protein